MFGFYSTFGICISFSFDDLRLFLDTELRNTNYFYSIWSLAHSKKTSKCFTFKLAFYLCLFVSVFMFLTLVDIDYTYII